MRVDEYSEERRRGKIDGRCEREKMHKGGDGRAQNEGKKRKEYKVNCFTGLGGKKLANGWRN